MNRILLTRTATALLIAITALAGCKKNPPRVNSVALDQTTLELTEGQSATLAATISPADVENKAVLWASSDDAIATVDPNGKVTAAKAGEATITVTTDDGGKTASCKVTVKAPAVAEKTLVSIAVTAQPAKKIYLAGETFDPAGMTITATYSDETTATVTVTAAMLSYDFSAAGIDKTVTITVEGKTASVAGIIVIAATDPGTQPGTGDGTEANPFRVATEADLRKVGTETGAGKWTLCAHYLQTTDITLTGDWTPIGTSSDSFKGSYDGGGKTIRGLKVNAPTKEYQGLFGNSSGIIKNVGLIDVNINGSSYVGGIAGVNGGTIRSCFVSGYVSSSNSIIGYVGGITGENRKTIENCYASCILTGKAEHCGGIAGISGALWASSGSMMRYCYATGSVTGRDYVGGIAGSTKDYDNTVLQNCVALNSCITATQAIDGIAIDIGRIYGGTDTKGVYTGNYTIHSQLQYNMDASRVDGNQGINITSAEYRSAAWWSGTAKFPADAWIFEDGKLPILKVFAAGTQNPPPPEEADTGFNTAAGEYWGNAYKTGTANFILKLYHSSNPDYALVLDGYSTLPANGFADFALDVGTYTVTETEAAGTIYPGYVDGEYIYGCVLFDDRGQNIQNTLITGGTVTITQSGNTCLITTDLTGEDEVTGAVVNNIRLTFTGPVTFTDRSQSNTEAKSAKSPARTGRLNGIRKAMR
jgi:hypothetical protein